MGIPTLITVSGTILDGGAPVSGRMVWASQTLVRDNATNDVMLPQEIEVPVGSDGEFSVQIPSTDDPGFSPTRWTWEVRPHFPHWTTPFSVAIPYNSPGGALSFSAIAPVPPNGDGQLYALAGHVHAGTVTSVAGRTGAVTLAAADVSGVLPLTGGTLTGDLAIDGALLRIDGAPGSFRQLQYGSGADAEDVRWSIHTNNTAESGANAGSDLRIVRYDDAGEALDAPFGINRATGFVALEHGLTVANVDFRQAIAHARPVDHNLAGWTFDPVQIQAGTVLPTAGLAYVARIRAVSNVISNIHFHVTAGGTSLTSGQCFASLHNDAGALLGAGAITASAHGTGAAGWGDAGYKTLPLNVAQGVVPYDYYRILWWFNGAGGPAFARASAVAASVINAGMSAPVLRFSTANSGLTTAAPGNIGAQTADSQAWWVGAS